MMDPYRPIPGSRQTSEQEAIDQRWQTEQLDRKRVTDDAPTQPLVISELAVQVVKKNYLVCKLFDGLIVFGDNINVAKDPELRHSSYHGQTIDGLEYSYTGVQARTVTIEGSSDSTDQVVIPKYHVPADGGAGFVGSVISALPIATRVLGDDGTTTIQCELREFTQRAWAIEEGA